tara:strand:- start:1630 stop:2430 length:801 start_codon:yes stop_codon:yes gene_type:complete
MTNFGYNTLGFGSFPNRAVTSGAVQFPGETCLERGADLTNCADSQFLTYSFWFRLDAGNDGAFLYSAGENRFFIKNTGSAGFGIEGRQTGGNTRILDLKHAWATLNANNADTTNWHHACGSVDTRASANNNFFIDDNLANGYRNGALNSGNVDFTNSEHTIGALPSSEPGGARVNKYLLMSIYEFWIGHGQNFPLTTTSNRRKFINADLTPVGLGSDGSTPTGTAPLIYMTGTPSEFVNNLGSGGDFSVTEGALVDVGPPTKANAP